MPEFLTGLSHFSHFDYTILAINFLLLFFAKPIIGGFRRKESKSIASKVFALRSINLILIALYVAALFVEGWSKQISLTGLTFLIAFIISHLLHVLILQKFGREKEIDGTVYRTETYQSEMFLLFVTLLAFIASIITVINIWGLNDWLKATSVLGILALLIFSTKDVWIPDNISGLIMLYNADIEPGAVVRIPEHDILAIVVQISLIRTTFKDLKTRHLITLPNTRVRNSKVEVLSSSPGSSFQQFAIFNIGYETPSEDVEALLTRVWETACEESSTINADYKPVIRVIETGDHAVSWRLAYKITNLFQMLEADCLIKRLALDFSKEAGIGLNTPLTHSVELEKNIA